MFALAAAILALSAPALGQPPPAASALPGRADQPLPALAPADVPKDIAWGKGREIQAGLRLSWRYGHADQHTGLYVFAVYVRNVTQRTLTVSGPGFPGLCVPSDRISYTTLVQTTRIYCTPRIADASAKAVAVKYRLSDDQQRWALGPGQAAIVSRWMLRTLPVAARKPETEGYTQVAFVEPGKYRLACDVAASWPRRATQRTGEVGFEVTAEDLGGRPW